MIAIRNNLKIKMRNFLMVLGLGLHTSTAGGTGSIPGWRTKIPQASQYGQKIN